ncbi:MAG: exosortase family protein XrtG [Leuconostoc sp.]|uniref:exosortase family protein XrtG n=1 Tax=Leuconostoc sp. TaxID=1930076 RepID=UPI0039E93CC1
MPNNAVLIGLLVSWIYILSVLKRAKTDAFYFLVGSAGMFVLLLLWSKPYGVWLFSTIVTWSVGTVGHITGLFDTFSAAHVIRVISDHQTSILIVDYECSGIIETTAFWGLIAFYPVYSLERRAALAAIGAGWFFGANIIRLTLVAAAIYFLGPGSFFIVHSIIGRLGFYAVAILWYYLVFTKGQLVNQVLSRKG